jgi:hypothetical protein
VAPFLDIGHASRRSGSRSFTECRSDRIPSSLETETLTGIKVFSERLQFSDAFSALN